METHVFFFGGGVFINLTKICKRERVVVTMLYAGVRSIRHHEHRALEWFEKESPELGLNFLMHKTEGRAIFCYHLSVKNLDVVINSLVSK